MTNKLTKPAWLCLAFLFLLSTVPCQLSAQVPQEVTAKQLTDANGDLVALLQYLPKGHKSPGNNRTYPLIIFLHGGGKESNNTSITPGSPVWLLTGEGPLRVVTSSYQNKMNFTWNNQVDTFIVIEPLSKVTSPFLWPLESIDAVINYAKTSLNVDEDRIFMTGHSYGGGGTFRFINYSQANASTLAGAVPVSTYLTPLSAIGKTYVKTADLPLWGFHAADDDVTSPTITESSIDGVNALSPDVIALKKIWPAGFFKSFQLPHNRDPHDGPINHVWNINNSDTGHPYGTDSILNIYEWFLGQNKSLSPNDLPVANAGPDQQIAATPGTCTLVGTNSSDVGGGILRYLWKQLDGPTTVTINNIHTTSVSAAAQYATQAVTGLTAPGLYRFELTVVDTRSAVSQDTVDITVGTGTGKAVTPSTSGNISAGNVTQLNNASKFTLETWFKFNATSTGYTTLFAKSGGSLNRIMVHIAPNTNAIEIFLANGANTFGITTSNAVSPGNWYHLAVVFDGTLSGSSNRLKLFLDGAQKTLSYSSTTIPASTGTNSSPLRAGGEAFCCVVNGTIDEVRVWNTALSSGTINAWKDKLLASCHPDNSNLTVYWPLDNDANPTSAAPGLGTAYTGTMANNGYVPSSQATQTVSCSTAHAFTMGTSGNISAGNVTQLNNATKFTLETWFKFNATSTGYTTLFAKSGGSLNRIMVHIAPNTNAIELVLANGTNTFGTTTSNAVSPGNWYHLAVVYDGTLSGSSNRLKLFLDGVPKTLSYSSTTIPASTGTNSSPLRAGGEASCCMVDGTIDEVRVWNTALSSGTINAWKDKLLGSCHPDISNLTVYWPLDNDASSTSAAPGLGTAYTGTMASGGNYVTSSQATADSDCGMLNAVLAPLEEVSRDKTAIGRIYPNPTKGLVQIELKATVLNSVTVNVLDMTGKYYYRNRTPHITGKNSISLNISSLPPGTYIVEIGDGRTIREKYKVVKR